MKQEPGWDMVIYGSASIVQTLTNLGLIDTYQLLVYPVVLGSGKPLFQDILHKVKLSLVSTKTILQGSWSSLTSRSRNDAIPPALVERGSRTANRLHTARSGAD